jgi:hypothetical protein
MSVQWRHITFGGTYCFCKAILSRALTSPSSPNSVGRPRFLALQILARQRNACITRLPGSEAVGARCTLEELLAVAFEQMIVAPPRVLTLEDMKTLIQGKSLFQTIACQDTPTPLHIVLHILGCMPAHCLYQGSIIYFWVLCQHQCHRFPRRHGQHLGIGGGMYGTARVGKAQQQRARVIMMDVCCIDCSNTSLPGRWVSGMAMCTQQCAIVHVLQQVPVELGSCWYRWKLVWMSCDRQIRLQLQNAALHHLEQVGHVQSKVHLR